MLTIPSRHASRKLPLRAADHAEIRAHGAAWVAASLAHDIDRIPCLTSWSRTQLSRPHKRHTKAGQKGGEEQ